MTFSGFRSCSYSCHLHNSVYLYLMTFNRILTSPIGVQSLYRGTRIYSQSEAEILSLLLFIIQIYMVYVPWLYYTNRNIFLCEGTRRFMLVHISRRTHICTYIRFIYLYRNTYTRTCPYHRHILIKSPVGVLEHLCVRRYP